jgi:hypothetical protein
MENPESQATLYQRKKIEQISGIEDPESQATRYQRKKIKQIIRMCRLFLWIVHF